MHVPPPLPTGTGHFPIDAFGVDTRPASYDAVVYTVGNSDGHLSTVETALRYPGWIWLHEVRLPASRSPHSTVSTMSSFSASLAWLLDRSYPGRAPTAARCVRADRCATS